jgi:protein-tyrosine phosphatase
MSSELKVTFSDKNNRFQYDGHAERIKVPSLKKKGGKLYLGDRDSCSMVQLKHRSISHVVNCDTDQHLLCREENISYLKVDPIVDKPTCLDKSFRFIDEALELGKNTLITCHTGYGKSACILIYYIMKRESMTLADAHRHVESVRPGIKSDSKTSGFRPDLVKLLQQQEKYLFKGQAASTRLDERTMVYTDGKGPAVPVGGASNIYNPNSKRNSKSTAKNSGGLGAVKAVAYMIALFLFLFFFIGAVGKFIDKYR